MQDLERAHKSMHGMVKHLVDLKSAGRAQDAGEEYQKVYESSKEVVALISAVEKEVK
jgi:hypothetical protein